MLVSSDELQRYMDIRLSNRQLQACDYVLSGLQSELESYLRRPIEVGSFTETYKVDSRHFAISTSSFFYDESLNTTQQSIAYLLPPYTVYLRNSPVVSVSSVKVTKPSPGSVETTLTEGVDYVVLRYGIDIGTINDFGPIYANDTIEVEYTAGLDGDEIKIFRLLILRAASREMQNMHDDVVGVKDLETRNVGPLVTGFTEEELRSVKRYKRVRVA